MGKRLFLGLSIALSVVCSVQAYGQDRPQVRDAYGTFVALGQEATPELWSAFTKAGVPWKKGLWDYHRGHGASLKDWHWTFRVGWIHACRQQIRQPWCVADILNPGLQDSALVVRSAAALALGDLLRGSKDSGALALLTTAFSSPHNRKDGRPLFILRHILWALFQIGLDKEEGRALCAPTATLAEYWAKLTREGL